MNIIELKIKKPNSKENFTQPAKEYGLIGNELFAILQQIESTTSDIVEAIESQDKSKNRMIEINF